MNTLESIRERKSTRQFLMKEVSKQCVEEIILCGMQAPSPKNDQPWYFCVIQEQDKKDKIASILSSSLETLKKKNEKEGIQREDIKRAFDSVNILKTASVLIFVFLDNNVYSVHDDGVEWNLSAKDIECTHIQAIGAAIQNMLLAAIEKGIDSVWLGDVFYAYRELKDFIGQEGCMMAAVALGYGSQKGIKPSRKSFEEKVRWI